MDSTSSAASPELNLAQSPSTSAQAAIFDPVGMHSDGWCEPAAGFKIKPHDEISTCQFQLWLKPESDRSSARFSVRVNGGDPFNFTAPYDVPVTAQVACDCPAEGTAQIAILCDNLVSEKGGDTRNLSYTMNRITFS